jgi:hypothetical protein
MAGWEPDDVADAMELPRMGYKGIPGEQNDLTWSGGESTGEGSAVGAGED